jgi:DinB superfamily/Pentapeptide repeats (8 copies)
MGGGRGLKFPSVTRAFSRDDDLRGAAFDAADLSGAVFRECDLTGVRMYGVLLVDVELSGLVQGLVLNDVEVGALVEAELDRRHPERLLFRATEPGELRRGWDFLERQWAGTVALIAALPDEQRRQQVGGEWSAVDTLRHLIFVIDSWFAHEVLRKEQPFHPWGLPPDFVPAWDEMGIDRDGDPSFDEVVSVRAGRQQLVRDWLASVRADELARPTAPREDPCWPPPGDRTVADCLHVLLDEEWWHHRYAVRDLAALENPAAGSPGDSVA